MKQPRRATTASARSRSDEGIVVVGAGPAGLTGAYQLAKSGRKVVVLEADPRYVGGISRTAEHAGYRFDIGGHRFFSKSREVEDFWTEILPEDLLLRPRKSRIYYQSKFYSYPLQPLEALRNLGLVEAARCGVSYVQAKARPVHDPKSFEDWVTNAFGSRLYEIFFKHYTEKVWGMKCTEISADWAAQRIKGLSLTTAVLSALTSRGPRRKGAEVIKTLIEEFRYPRLGPGMMWERCAERIVAMGSEVRMGHRVERIARDASGYTVRYRTDAGEGELHAPIVISSAPLRQLVEGLEPAAPAHVLRAARALRYRDFLTVVLIVKDEDRFDDNWIYVQDAHVKVGRIQNFKAWSPEMVPDPRTACYGLEYFCFEGDGLWSSDDQALIALGKREMAALGLLDPSKVVDGCVVRQPKAYPVYDERYAENVETVRRWLTTEHPTLYTVGRNGMHRYNNQDHSMMTAMLVAENVSRGEDAFDPWRVNQDAEYIEAGTAGGDRLIERGGRMVPKRDASA